MQTSFANFKKYDKKGRRLSIFAEVAENTLKVTVFTCSLDDQFSKRVGYIVYENWKIDGGTANPEHFTIAIVDEKPLKSFLNWCNQTFYHYDEWVVDNAVMPLVYRERLDGTTEGHQVGEIKLSNNIEDNE